MNFEDWWATLSPPERRVIGEHNARFVWGEAVEACAKVCEAIYNDPKGNDGYDCYYTRPYLECADAIRSKGQ